MSLVVRRLAVPGPHGPLLQPTSLAAVPGEVTLVAGDPGPAGIALALALAARLRGAEGEVTLDGDPDPVRRREAVALIDVPEVTEPEPAVPVATVLGEELALAGRPARRADIQAFASSAGHREVGARDAGAREAGAREAGARDAVPGRGDPHDPAWAADALDLSARWEAVDPGLRERWLLRAATLRPGLRVLVLTHPDRWGGDPHVWYAEAASLAADLGLVVVVTCTHATARLLGAVAPAEIGVAS